MLPLWRRGGGGGGGGGRGCTKVPILVSKSNIKERGLHVNSDITTYKYYASVIIFCLFFVSTTAAELLLGIWWWCHLKHWPSPHTLAK